MNRKEDFQFLSNLWFLFIHETNSFSISEYDTISAKYLKIAHPLKAQFSCELISVAINIFASHIDFPKKLLTFCIETNLNQTIGF